MNVRKQLDLLFEWAQLFVLSVAIALSFTLDKPRCLIQAILCTALLVMKLLEHCPKP
jgi:hypothetical protein